MTTPRPRPSHDVVIVGARAAGAATALLLARAGLDVLVVDRGRYGADTLSTHALMRGGVVQLHRWGLLDAVVDAGTPPVRSTTFSYANDEITVPVKPAHGVDALYAPRRTVLDPILVDAAEALGVTFRFGVRVTDVTRDDRGRVDGISGRDEQGRPVGWRARWVVGADGVHSSVAGAVGAPVEHRGTGVTAAVYGYWAGLEADGYEWYFRPGACAGVIPTNGDAACVFAIARPRRIGRGGMHAFHDVVAEAAPALPARLAARRGAGRRPLVRRRPRLPAPAVRAGLGAGGRRRLLEGPDQRPRPHRRPARRRVPRPRHHRRRRRRRRAGGDAGVPPDPRRAVAARSSPSSTPSPA